ncbi:glucosaminidase domain-containing protein [Flavobacteriaceae bacterium XHP0103]|uniref:glucosaminidase domain-containing protein n=1 Tax=Marixanthotalea marina TaxID=2844359 RepID=UPI002989A539|nr:glucosaminidase domain-containing protein [Marixanthotalea marina]MBU3821782.1 glucosaminidase domain-containing protein [Marixanthotalea marina]
MKKIVVLLVLGLVVFSCGTKKVATRKKETRKEPTERVVIPKNTDNVPLEGYGSNTASTNSVEINSTEDYLAAFSSIAQEEMRLYGIPASITLAQGILESGSGKGRLSVEANNHFGIKCHDWTGDRIYHDDDALQECFRKYVDAKYSFRDHSLFLTTRKRYADLFELRKNDYKGWAKGLKAAGYATDRKYPDKLISLIERYELYKLDEEVLGGNVIAYNDTVKANENEVYVVVKGDTLYSISRKYNLTVKELQDMNGLNGTTISIGQALQVKPSTKDY